MLTLTNKVYRSIPNDTKSAIKNSSRFFSHDKNYAIRSEKIENRRRKLMLSKILRVDHAGEVGADRIYAGQMAVLGNTEHGPIIKVLFSLFLFIASQKSQKTPRYEVLITFSQIV